MRGMDGCYYIGVYCGVSVVSGRRIHNKAELWYRWAHSRIGGVHRMVYPHGKAAFSPENNGAYHSILYIGCAAFTRYEQKFRIPEADGMEKCDCFFAGMQLVGGGIGIFQNLDRWETF